jgi:aryl-alcohol dehydrogenase-like predicted oxidoreductase
MQNRTLGRSGIGVSPLGFGAFKIGRNQGMKYPSGYDIPDENSVSRLLNEVLDLGMNYIDTAPAYGVSEERIGKNIGHRRDEFLVSTKVGETFLDGKSTFDFSAQGIRTSVERSLDRLKTDVIDIVYIHSSGDDLAILRESDAVATLLAMRDSGNIRLIGMSGKTVEGATAALAWSDVLMVEYHLQDRSHETVIAQAAAQGVAVVVKKGLAAGHLPAPDALRFLFENPAISSVVVGGLNVEHLRSNVAIADDFAIHRN